MKGIDNYHHGDLKNELIYKGIYILAKEGYEALTLRKLASFCGVSHAAPYRHFKSKEELVFAITDMFGEQLAQTLQKSLISFREPKARLIDMGKQYIEFMTDNPDYFRFVFMMGHKQTDKWDDSQANQNMPLNVLMQTAGQYFDPNGSNESKSKQDFLGLWSILQGYVLLLVNQTIKKDGNYLDKANAMLESYLNGTK